MIRNEDKEVFAEAFRFYEEIIKKRKIEQVHKEIFQLYRDAEVREVLEDVIEPIAKIKFIQLDPSQTIYVVPMFDNQMYRYNNEELRNIWKLKNNQELYVVQFSMLVLLSMFYNRDTQTLTERTSVSLTEFSKNVNHYIEKFKHMSSVSKDIYTNEFELDIKSIVETWDQKMLVVETAKNPIKAPSGQIGTLNRVLSFLEKEELIQLIGDEIKLTSKINTLVLRYYFNDTRRNELFEFLSSPIFSMKGTGEE
jgi:hypothetical protein